MAVVNRNTSIEFVVRPKHDLFLEGSLRKLPRVTKGSAKLTYMHKVSRSAARYSTVILCFLLQANRIRVRCRKTRILAACLDTMQSIMVYAKKVCLNENWFEDAPITYYLFFLDLIFSFVDELQADQTPETVHLMSQGNELSHTAFFKF